MNEDHPPDEYKLPMLTEEEIIEQMIPCGYSGAHVKRAMNHVQNEGDVLEIKEWLDGNIDLKAEAQEAMDKYKADKANKVPLDANQSNEPMNEDTNEEKEVPSTDKTEIIFPVQVFARFRPLIKEEIEAKDQSIVYDKKYIKKTKSTTININDITARKKRRRIPLRKSANTNSTEPQSEPIKLKKFKGFKSILQANDNNHETFKQCILPSVDNIFKGFIVCSFAYGHTGSGKTHTILGYDDKQSPGMYRLTAQYMNDKLEQLNQNIEKEEDQLLLSCRFAELYQGKMRDLFGNLVECHVREDDKGNICIRGLVIKDEQSGEVRVQPLQPIYIKTGQTNKLIERVTEALKLRKQGSSVAHDESSRSHVFLEMELVSNSLMKARYNLWKIEGKLVPTGKRRDDVIIAIQAIYYGQWSQDGATGEWKIDPCYVPDTSAQEKLKDELKELDRKFIIFNVKILECKKAIEKVMNGDKRVGGTMVFIDLAGNEWGHDSKVIKNDNNVQLSERKEINKSLLSLKECVRALHSHKGHVPYRDSKLTMVLLNFFYSCPEFDIYAT